LLLCPVDPLDPFAHKVSFADTMQEVGTCSEIGIDILQQGGNAADGESAFSAR
jgi:gamma-glutamyltranspeptidase